ncbi:hypothetical protein VA602_12220 [Pseudomonas sp. MH2]|uniref:Immunity protein 8 n=1 Tax=Pseudomonas machongensis TaxID=3110229 RepID=A0ABU5VJ75_9PSED|nr:hypothetical protein [Pseudomonas sp. MH2]MEA5672105.1 hypothetical protein [Pseudomonas sp. MH2]
MNIIQTIVQQHTLMALRIPTGWSISKNDFVDIGPDILETIDDEHVRFLVTQNFFADNIFMAGSERTLDSGVPIYATLDIWCRAPDEERMIEYQASINVYKGKKKTSIFSLTCTTENRYEAREMIDRWATAFTWKVLFEFESAGLPIEHYFSAEQHH